VKTTGRISQRLLLTQPFCSPHRFLRDAERRYFGFYTEAYFPVFLTRKSLIALEVRAQTDKVTRDGPITSGLPIYIVFPPSYYLKFILLYIRLLTIQKTMRQNHICLFSPSLSKFKNFDKLHRCLFLSTKKMRKAAHVFCSPSSKFLKYLQTIPLPFCGLAKMWITGIPCWILCSLQNIQQPHMLCVDICLKHGSSTLLVPFFFLSQ
jgi:hypothetical protein